MAKAHGHGGSAFPATIYVYDDPPIGPDYGMSLRDYFAAKAMQGLITARCDAGFAGDFDTTLARWSYETADAMLAERKK